jgi:pimeloyl-ACP methyl ester carboxylesterase
MTMRMVALLGGRAEPPALAGLASRIHAPVLVIASGARDEATIDRALAERIGPSAQLWEIPRAGHTGGLDTAPAAYRQRVIAFLRAALVKV